MKRREILEWGVLWASDATLAPSSSARRARGVLSEASSSEESSDWISVRTFGARGDGVTDDLAAIQAAVTAAAAGGGVVYFPPGTYAISGPISLSTGARLFGDATIKHKGRTLHAMLEAKAASHIGISGLRFDGDMMNVAAFSRKRWDRVPQLSFESCADVLLDRIEISSAKGPAISANRCTRFRLSNSYVHDTDNWVVVLKESADVDYLHNRAENCVTHGFYVDGSSGGGSLRVRMIGNTAINMKHDPDYVDSGIGFSVNNTGLAPVTDVLVAGNFAMNNGSMGLSLTPGGPPAVGKMIVAHNMVEGHTANVGIGIELIGTEIVATGNVLRDNQYQMTLQRCRGVLIHGNSMISSPGSRHIGVFFGPASAADRNEAVAVRNNLIEGGTGFQISSMVTTPSHKNIALDGNTFANCEHALLMQTGGSLISIMHNVIDCDDPSVALGSGIHCCGASVRVAENVIRPKAGQPAIAIHATTRDLELRGNTIEGGAYGIAVGAPVTGMYVAGNQLRGLGSGHWSAKENVVDLVDAGENSWNFDKAKPSSGFWSAGQRVYNLSPASNGRAGWVCVKSGTPGDWVEF